jgi:hypothetical protein
MALLTHENIPETLPMQTLASYFFAVQYDIRPLA